MTQRRIKVNKIPDSILFAEYERRKRKLEKLDIDHIDYQKRVIAIAQGLGI